MAKRIVALKDCRFEVLTDKDAFLGLGKVWIGRTLIRSGRLPMAPEELSTCSRAGESFSKSNTTPSAPSRGFLRAIFFISDTASLTRFIAGCERQPKACRLKRARKVHLWEEGFDFMIILFLFGFWTRVMSPSSRKL